MNDRKKLVELLGEALIYADERCDINVCAECPSGKDCDKGFMADHLIANCVTVQKYGKWKLHSNGSGTCDQCHFTQKGVWDFDSYQEFCGKCGAKMSLEAET